MKLRKLLPILLAALLSLLAVPVMAEGFLTAQVADIQKYGNLILDITAQEVLTNDFDYGDLAKVTINEQEFSMPVGSNYSDVDQGSFIFRVIEEDDTVILAINMGDLATTAGIAEKETIEEDPGFKWNYLVDQPVSVLIEMEQKGGYYDEYLIHQLTRTNEREDYPDLSDEEFANFRMITTTGIGEGKVYRSSSPCNPEIGRNTYADAAAKAAGIKTVMNLADAAETMAAYEGFGESYYSTLSIIPLNLGVDFTAADFKEGLVKGFTFLSEGETPFLIHCNEGKDRAGFTSAMLECLMGASAEEIVTDYMVTYYNYYGVEEGTEQYEAVARSNIEKSLATAFGIESIYGEDVDLSALAESYLLENGMAEEAIAALKEKVQ